jgi:hypothetical protein
MSGVFYIGVGDQFDGDKVKAYPPDSVVVLPGNTSHFQWAKSGEYVTQVTAIGPLDIEYLDPGDDPREQNRWRTHRSHQSVLGDSSSSSRPVMMKS